MFARGARQLQEVAGRFSCAAAAAAAWPKCWDAKAKLADVDARLLQPDFGITAFSGPMCIMTLMKLDCGSNTAT
jgi:hypothetical protein